MALMDEYLCGWRLWRRLRGGVWWTSSTDLGKSGEWFKAKPDKEAMWSLMGSSRVREGDGIGSISVEDYR